MDSNKNQNFALTEEQIKNAFNEADKDKNQTLSKEEAESALSALNIKSDKKDIEPDATFNLEEFEALVTFKTQGK